MKRMTHEEVRPLLPALVHLARFPTCNLRVICERWGVSASAVMEAMVVVECESARAGHSVSWGEDALAAWAKRKRVSLPAWQALPAVSSGAALRALALRKVERRPALGARVVVPEPSPVPAWVLGRPRSRRWEYSEVLRLIAGGERETVACKRVGLSLASWRYFRESRGLGRRGEMDAAKVRLIRRELAGATK